MYVFKTSGTTLGGVVAHQRHAFVSQPGEWQPGELVLVSKNRTDCAASEKQIQYVMRIRDVTHLAPGEAEKYWPGNEGRWKYLIRCDRTHRLRAPFNLRDVLGERANVYDPVVTFKRMTRSDEERILDHLHRLDADAT